MLAFIKEKDTLWEYLKTIKKPIVLYGTGNGAEKILHRLAAENITVSDIFVSDEFYRGQNFCGFTVRKYSDLESLNRSVVVLIAFAGERPALLERFAYLAQIQETYAPHVLLFTNDEIITPDWLAKNEAAIQHVYDQLADDMSRKVFAAVLNYKLSGKLFYLQECETKREEDLQTLFRFDFPGVYVDAGAYDGDTIKEFLRLSQGQYKKIYAIEPDSKNFLRLCNTIREEKLNNIVTVRAGVWERKTEKILAGNGGRQSTLLSNDTLASRTGEPLRIKADTMSQGSAVKNGVISRRKKVRQQKVLLEALDDLLQDESADYIKFDVEGVEKEALLGTAQHLIRGASGRLPQLLIAAYHHDSDIILLPLLLWELQPDYKIYLRKHPYVPAWEINFFAC